MLFWHDKWNGQWSMKDLFPQLFSLSANQFGVVEEFGQWDSGRWLWWMKWNRELSAEEHVVAAYMENILLPLQPAVNVDDKWIWLLDKTSSYKVKSTHKHLVLRCAESMIEEDQKLMLKTLCKAALQYRPSI